MSSSNTPSAPKKTSSGTARRTGQDSEDGATNSSGQPKVLLSELQSFLSGLQTGGADGAAGGRSVDLASAINADSGNTN